MTTSSATTSTKKLMTSKPVMIGAIIIGLTVLKACMAIGNILFAERPADSEFGLGPRTSNHGIYRASLDTMKPLSVGEMQSVNLRLEDASGKRIDGATISIDGGMPQHGHGLPTNPRVTRNTGNGQYAVDGLKFNMGGWWVLNFRVNSHFGTDTVEFNLDL
jgi:hypothetical protein